MRTPRGRRLLRLGMEHAPAGTRLHAVADEAVTAKVIAEAVGRSLGLRVVSIAAPDAAAQHPRFLSAFSGISPHFRPRRHLMPAHGYRAEMTVRSTIWEHITGVTGQATTT